MATAPVSLPGPDSELSRLTAAQFDGSLTATDRDRLATILRDPAARVSYRRIVWLHANLMRIWCQDIGGIPWMPQPARDEPAASAAAAPAHHRPRITIHWDRLGETASRAAVLLIAMAMGASLLGIGIMAVIASFSSPVATGSPRPPRAAGSIAEIAAVESPEWATGAEPFGVWASLMPSTTLALDRGRVELAYDSGATVVLEGPAVFTVAAAASAALDRGKATITVAGPGPGDGQPRFTLQTPSATVTDLGTSFGVLVSDAGETSVSVFDGLVDLLPRFEAAAPLRLTAGEAGDALAKQPARKVYPPQQRFERSLPKAPPDLVTALARDGWNEARATVLIRDSFTTTGRAAGPLAGSQPSARGGAGDDAWQAPGDGWSVDSATGALVATSHGTATLPFVPQPGHRYRISATIQATSGGIGWGGIGFTNGAGVATYIPNGPWLLQRHRTAAQPNHAYAGPGETNTVGRGDTLTGEQTRTILLDTTRPQWRAIFFVDGIRLGEAGINPQSAAISHVCLAAFPNSRIEFRHFLVATMAR
jgi:hypothetical protein